MNTSIRSYDEHPRPKNNRKTFVRIFVDSINKHLRANVGKGSALIKGAYLDERDWLGGYLGYLPTKTFQLVKTRFTDAWGNIFKSFLRKT